MAQIVYVCLVKSRMFSVSADNAEKVLVGFWIGFLLSWMSGVYANTVSMYLQGLDV